MSSRLTEQLWSTCDVTGSHRDILHVLCDAADDDGYCCTSMDRMALKVGCTKRNILYLLGKLQEEMVVQVVNQGRGRGNMNIYRVDLGSLPTKVLVDQSDDWSLTIKGEHLTVNGEDDLTIKGEHLTVNGEKGEDRTGIVYTHASAPGALVFGREEDEEEVLKSSSSSPSSRVRVASAHTYAHAIGDEQISAFSKVLSSRAHPCMTPGWLRRVLSEAEQSIKHPLSKHQIHQGISVAGEIILAALAEGSKSPQKINNPGAWGRKVIINSLQDQR